MLIEQICNLKHNIQSLETHTIEIKQSMSKKHSTLQAHQNTSEKAHNVQVHIARPADNRENPINCAEKNILKQWQEVQIEKHKEFIHLKSIEKRHQGFQEKASNHSS